jgi:hypothetical protein
VTFPTLLHSMPSIEHVQAVPLGAVTPQRLVTTGPAAASVLYTIATVCRTASKALEPFGIAFLASSVKLLALSSIFS